jgi:DNA-binding MarR family transcriptional regulator
MDQIVNNLARYFKETLDIDVQPKKWPDGKKLPIFLRNTYDFFEGDILGKPCLIMAVKEKIEQTPAIVRKHMIQAEKKWPGEMIYLQQKVTAYNRKRLIQQKIPFIVPLNQMYLPFIGVDLREHFRNIRESESSFSPSAQVVLLDYLNSNSQLRITPKILAEKLGYSIMTMTRAFDELQSAGVCSTAMEGRERVLRFDSDKRKVWETALDRMCTPVKKKFLIKTSSINLFGIKAGLTALADYSNIAEPVNRIFALTAKEWQKIKIAKGTIILDIPEPNACGLEIWSYSPKLFEKNGEVDRFSLFLSLKDNSDERVQSELYKMMEKVEW